MSGFLFRGMWPIVDPSTPFSRLLAQAEADLPWILTVHRARITGPSHWRVVPSDRVPGSGGPGRLVLLYEAPAVEVPRSLPSGPISCAAHARRPPGEIDDAVVERVLGGDILPTTAAERRLILARWLARGGSEKSLCDRMGWKTARYTTTEAIA